MAEVSRKSSRRTIIRDPRKAKRVPTSSGVVAANNDTEHSSTNNNKHNLPLQQLQQPNAFQPKMPFEPTVQHQQSLGLGSYMLAGVGVAMGVTLVSAIFGAIV